MTRKEIIQMLLSMAVVLIILLYFFGWLPPPEKYEPPEITASSDSWELASRAELHIKPYFTYKGKGTLPRRAKVRGVGVYEIIDENKSIKTEIGIDEYVELGNAMITGVPLGEDRWFLENIGPIEEFQKVCCKITWDVGGKSFSEYVISDNLSEEQIEQIKKEWIDTDSQDYNNPISSNE